MADFDREDIGYLTKPVDMPKWISQVQTRSPFLRDLTPDELRSCARNALTGTRSSRSSAILS